MGIFAALFSSKPKAPAPTAGSPAATPSKPVRPSEPQRVVATSGMPVAKPNGVPPVPKPVASAAALQMPRPVLPRSITQRLNSRPALPPPRSSEPLSLNDVAGSPGQVTLTLGDVLPQIPVAVLDQNVPMDLGRLLCFPMDQLSAEMARGRPAVPLSSVARQCPELFRQPESIDGTQMVRLPLQKLLEQIGKLKRIDFANPPRTLNSPRPAESQPQPAPVTESPLELHEAKPQGVSSWLQSSNPEPANAPATVSPPSIPASATIAEAVLQPFHTSPSDDAKTIAADVIEIVSGKAEPTLAVVDEAETISEEATAEPCAGSRIEEYEVPAFGEAPVVEVADSEDVALDFIDSWPLNTDEEEIASASSSQPAAEIEAPPPVVEPPLSVFVRPAMPTLKSALTDLPPVVPSTVQTKVEPGPFVVIGPVISESAPRSRTSFEPERLVVREEPADLLPVQKAPEVSLPTPTEKPPVTEPIQVLPPAAKTPPTPAPQPAPVQFESPRNAPNPVIPKFPLRAPRFLSKSSRPDGAIERVRPTPPRSPVFIVAPLKPALAATSKPSEVATPRLFGANPLDRYFSTKAAPAVNWYAAGALLSVVGDVTPTRIADAIVQIPGITGCMLAAPPNLTVSGRWPIAMAVDNSLAFGRRLAGVLKQGDASIVAHRQIVTDSGMLLIFAIDDLLLCVIAQGMDIPPATRQRLLVVTKAMAHARQSVRKSVDAES